MSNDEYLPSETSQDDSFGAVIDAEIAAGIPKSFGIDSEANANWLLRKIADARSYAVSVKRWAEQELRRAAQEEKTLMFLFGRQLEGWTKSELERRGGRRKSISLPGGTVGFRATAPHLVIDDESLVLRWAKENCPEAVAVTVTERLSKVLFHEYVKKTGHIPDTGVHLDPGGERFYAK